ncbi:site-specific DNA-methyltransferase (adenine-specific) [Candidatus Electronema halotolerans]
MRESEYVKNTSIRHRKTYGQFFTPSPVARLMAQWILKDEPKTIIDPAFGLGIFYDEVMSLKPNYIAKFVGYEIDSNIFTYLDKDNRKTNLKIFNSNYLEANHNNKYDAVICNPPYLRFQNFLNRHNILPIIEKQVGEKIAGYSNISSIFLVKALSELNENGNLAFIMPFEFFNTGYGREIKKILTKNYLLKQIVIFYNEKEIFPDATTTVCVLLCKKDKKRNAIKITKIESIDNLYQIADIDDYYHKKIGLSDLPPDKKWTPILMSLFSSSITPYGFVKLSFYGSFTRGIATGANSFFSLKKEKIIKLGIGKDNICKCVTKSSQIRKPIFTEEDFVEIYNFDKPVYCLNVADASNNEIQKYIKYGEDCGYNKRYLTRMRNPWYKIERRTPAPILFGVFNRGRVKVVRNFTDAINFTCFHCFYPNIFGINLIDKIFIYLLSNIGQDIIRINKRTYGDNLDKFEPGDLNKSLAPSQYQFEMITDKEVKEIIEIAKNNEGMAIEMSNFLIERITNK